MKTIFFLIFCLLLCGCGHNVVHVDRGTGMVLRVPTFDGYNLLEFKFGNIDSTTMVLRGGSSYDSSSSSGGSTIGTSGNSGRIFFSSIPQLNEGYVAKVLSNETVSQKVKMCLINKYLSESKPYQASDSKSVSIGSVVESGEKSDNIELKVTGIDNAVDKMSEATPTVIENASEIAQKTLEKTSDMVDVAPETVESVKIIRNGILIVFASVFIMIIVIVALCSKKR